MAFGECFNQLPDCPYAPNECKSNEHHEYWPRSLYREPVEKAFRNLVENVTQTCLYEHQLKHKEDPPIKPPLGEMIEAIEASEQHQSRSVRKQIKEYKHG